MPYKHSRPVIDLSPWFRIATAWTFYMIIPIAMCFNFIQLFFLLSVPEPAIFCGIQTVITVYSYRL